MGRKVALGFIAMLVGGAALEVASITGAFGTRGVREEYSFRYQGKPAVVKREDRRFANDRCWIEIEGRDKIYLGSLTTDDGKYIEVNTNFENKSGWSIRDVDKK